jgi:hypothetical protein
MNVANRVCSLTAIVISTLTIAACVPMEQAARPTLDQVRSGHARGPISEDARLLQGEIAGEIDRIDRGRREIYVVADDRRPQVLEYDIDRTRVSYHGWDYSVDNLEAGDRIAFRPVPRGGAYAETIRVLEPVQARSGPPLPRSTASRSRVEVIEGTVEGIDVGLGTFEVMPRGGRPVTVSVPYNARAADVDSFRNLRRGDQVRVEGEFVNPESLQLLAFISPRSR